MSTEQVEEAEDDLRVCVLFTHPVVASMRACPYFMDGKCRYDSGKCRFSHGLRVNLKQLREFEEIPCLSLEKDCLCLVKSPVDQLWYDSIVEKVLGNDHFLIKTIKSGDSLTVSVEDILPVNESEDEDSDESSTDSGPDSDIETSLGIVGEPLPVPGHASSAPALGEWEAHTKGIGSKLMKKMGYVWGQGLGKSGEGRIEPVEARIVPAGKSLDVCMELREQELTGNETRRKRKAKAREALNKAKIAKRYHRPLPEERNVFTFLNQRLNHSQHRPKDTTSESEATSSAKSSEGPQPEESHKSLKSVTKRGLQIKAFEVGEELRRAENELAKLRQALERNRERDRVAFALLLKKVRDQEEAVERLQRQEKTLLREENTRVSHQKLTVF
jgi:hypothetical protein